MTRPDITKANGYAELMKVLQRFCGYHNFTDDAIRGILHHINSVYMLEYYEAGFYKTEAND